MTRRIGNLLESVVRITEERDRKSLEKILVETLADFVDFDAVILLRTLPGEAAMEEAAAIPINARESRLGLLTRELGETRIARDKGMARCIDTGEIVSEALDGTMRILFPVGKDKNLSGVLAIYGHGCSDNAITLIRGFLRIHSNFLAVLDDNEHDTLTGLLNRKTFDLRISELISVAPADPGTDPGHGAERRKPCSGRDRWLGILDIDHFKKINDRYGHVYGDEVLLLFAGLMKSAFRHTDLLFRYGGEEFVVVLAPVVDADALMVFERFRRRLELFEFPQVGHATASIGMARLRGQEHPVTVVEHADKALYYAKENGRNQTCDYNKLIAAGTLQEQQRDGGIELF